MKTLISELIAVYTVAASVALKENLPLKAAELRSYEQKLQRMEEEGIIYVEVVPTLTLESA